MSNLPDLGKNNVELGLRLVQKTVLLYRLKRFEKILGVIEMIN